MIDQPPAATLLSLITVELDRLARQPADRSLGDADRYALRVVANLSRILGRELDPSTRHPTTLVASVRAAAEAVGATPATPATSGTSTGPEGLAQLVSALDETLRARVLQATQGGDPVPPWTDEERRQLHGQLLRSVVQRLEVNRPDYARPVHQRGDAAGTSS